MRRSLTLAVVATVLAVEAPRPAAALGWTVPAGPCNAGTGEVGGGTGSSGGGGTTCTYDNAVASFGASYLTNGQSAALQLPCGPGSAQTPAAHLAASSFALSKLSPVVEDDDAALRQQGGVPSAVILTDISDATRDFPTMPDVPGAFTSGPGIGHLMGCPSNLLENSLHRTWSAFGNSYYFGDPKGGAKSMVSDPVSLSHFACWSPATITSTGYYRYRAWDTLVNTAETSCTGAGYTGFDYLQCVYCLHNAGDTVPNPQTWTGAGTTTTSTTTAPGYGYYVTSNARSSSNASLFWSGLVVDFPPMYISLYWSSLFIVSNSELDLTGSNYIFPLRRELRFINNTQSTCGTSSTSQGNGMHPPCNRSDPYKGDSSFSSTWNAIDHFYTGFGGTAQGTDLPLAGAIWDAANEYITGGLTITGGGSSPSWCSTCDHPQIIVMSVGETCHDDGANTLTTLVDPTASCTGGCAYTSPTCTTRNGGTNTCDGSAAVWPPQLAQYVAGNDLLPSVPGLQTLTVDTIALGPHQDALNRAATASGGSYIDASQNPDQIHDALFSTLGSIIKQAVSTTSTPVHSVQASSGAQEELVALFRPEAGQGVYEGHLYKYYFFSEFASGCVAQGQMVNYPDGTSSASQIQCPCLGGQCTGRYSVDGNLGFVVRATDGSFHALTYSQLTSFYTSNGRYPTPLDALNYSVATPVWDMGHIMADSTNYPWWGRKAYTVIDSSGDGLITSADSLLQISSGSSSGVSAATADALIPYLDIVGSTRCSSIAGLSVGVTYPDTSPSGYRSCATAILNYALGQDLFDSNGNGLTTDNRSSMLGDIYHSTPIDIGPPAPESFCDFFPQRCTATLFNVNHPLDSANYEALDFPASYYADNGKSVTGSSAGPFDAYHAWVNQQTFAGTPPLVRVFGANDGWIHAVQFACYSGLTAQGLPNYYGGPGHGSCINTNTNNGTELWAMIPPDLLPKLAPMLLQRHQVFADATAMVRDIYYGSTSLKKVSDFRTVAIFGERNGGNHYFTLDVTNPLSPKFLWIFPQIGSVDELRAGLSWGEYLPGSPPIGPIRMSTTISGSPSYQGSTFHEQWVAMLPGGYDRYGTSGHGFWMLDAYTGQKYWEAWGLAGEDFPFGAPPALVNWGTSTAASLGLLNNGFFDTAVIGDLGGQLWTARFNALPTFAANSNGETLATNWSAARSFRQSDGDDTGTGPTYKMQNRLPFFSMPSLGRMPDSGYLRAYLGSGARGNVSDQYLGECSPTNPLACGKQAAVTMIERDGDIGATTLRGGETSYSGTTAANLTVRGTIAFSSAAAGQCTPADNILNACILGTSQQRTATAPNEPQFAEVNTVSGAMVSEAQAPYPFAVTPTAFNSATGQNGSITSVYATAGNGYYGRFYGVTLFSSARPLFDSTTAATYDSARITEAPTRGCTTPGTGLCNLYPSGVLASYAYPEQASSFNTPVPTTGTTDGFFFYYPNIDEKTTSNPLLANGCLLWTTQQPTSPCASDQDCAAFAVGLAGGGTATAGQCNLAANECGRSNQCNAVGGSSAGHIYQTNAVFGSTDCALVGANLPRATFGSVLAPPPPERIALVNQSSGSVEYAVVLPAGLPGTLLPPRATGGQLFRTFYDLDVVRPIHDCRHRNMCY